MAVGVAFRLVFFGVWGAAVAISGQGAHAATAVPQYDESLALERAYISTAAYCGLPKTPRETVEQWRCGPACDHVRGMQKVRQVIANGGRVSAMVGWHRGQCLVAFRGSADFRNWLEDVWSAWHANPNKHGMNCTFGGKVCWVTSGFFNTYTSIREFIAGNLTAIGCQPQRDVVTVTGHSMGAAMAQLAMFDLKGRGYQISTSYVFGSPRVGDVTWASAFNALLGPGSLYRVTLRHDPVPRLPPVDVGFWHAGSEVFYKGNTSEGHKICEDPSEDPHCIDGAGSEVGLITRCVHGPCDHLRYLTPRKQILMDGGTCVNTTSILV